jgi:hypothetical protein
MRIRRGESHRFGLIGRILAMGHAALDQTAVAASVVALGVGALALPAKTYALPVPEVSATVWATYNSVSDASTVTDPLLAEPTNALVGSSAQQALARASASMTGVPQLRSAVLVEEAGPRLDPLDYARATATSTIVTNWRATSSDPTLSGASIDANLIFNGVLSGGISALRTPAAYAEVNAYLYIDSGTGYAPAFSAHGRLQNNALSATANWSAHWQQGQGPECEQAGGGPRNAACLDFSELLSDLFVVPLNQPFAVLLALNTQAGVPVLDGELTIQANFFDSGGFDLSTSTPGVTLAQLTGPSANPVPEPGTLLLLASALVGWGAQAWRSRHRT